MANCADNVYVIKYTDKSKGTITITKSSLVTNLVDIALVGKSRLDYGEVFNENILHLLENFACPSAPNDPNVPDTSVAFGSLLSNPVDGQKWFNSTSKRLHVYNKTIGEWVPQAKQGDVAGNSGIIAHGEYLPRPVVNGYVFPYEECNFVVSQHSNSSLAEDDYIPSNTEIDYMRCFVSPDGKVTVQFRYRGESSMRNGYANYQIIGIRGETNTPLITVTPYPVPSPTPGVSATITPTPTPTVSVTKTPAVTPTKTPSSSVTPTPINSATPTPTVSVSKTPGASKTPTPTPTKSPAVTPTPTPTISLTPSPVYTINLSDIPTIIDHVSGVGSSASLEFNSDGTWAAKEKVTTVASGVWASSGIGNNYEIMYLYGGGNTPVAAREPGVWYSLGSGFSFHVQDSGSETMAYMNVTYTIRRKSDHSDSQQRSLSLSADGECFAVGTKLSMADGTVKNVEDLAVGDMVASYSHPTMIDESEENWREWKTNDEDFTFGNSAVMNVRRFFADGGIDINGIVTTRNHIHFIFDGENYGWKNASKVKMTDKLVDSDFNHIDILNITELEGKIEFVELDVETVDTLIVSHGDALILGHNVSA